MSLNTAIKSIDLAGSLRIFCELRLDIVVSFELLLCIIVLADVCIVVCRVTEHLVAIPCTVTVISSGFLTGSNRATRNQE